MACAPRPYLGLKTLNTAGQLPSSLPPRMKSEEERFSREKSKNFHSASGAGAEDTEKPLHTGGSNRIDALSNDV